MGPSPLLTDLMTGASRGKTMYVIPYLMAPPGSPLERYAAGVELTDTRHDRFWRGRVARVLEVLREATRILHLDHGGPDPFRAVAATPATVSPSARPTPTYASSARPHSRRSSRT